MSVQLPDAIKTLKGSPSSFLGSRRPVAEGISTLCNLRLSASCHSLRTPISFSRKQPRNHLLSKLQDPFRRNKRARVSSGLKRPGNPSRVFALARLRSSWIRHPPSYLAVLASFDSLLVPPERLSPASAFVLAQADRPPPGTDLLSSHRVSPAPPLDLDESLTKSCTLGRLSLRAGLSYPSTAALLRITRSTSHSRHVPGAPHQLRRAQPGPFQPFLRLSQVVEFPLAGILACSESPGN